MHKNHDQISVPSKVSPVYHWLYPNHVFASPFSQIFQYQNGTKKMLKNGPSFSMTFRPRVIRVGFEKGGGWELNVVSEGPGGGQQVWAHCMSNVRFVLLTRLISRMLSAFKL